MLILDDFRIRSILFLASLFVSGCGSPLTHRADSKNTSLVDSRRASPSSTQGLNLLQSRGCPIRFSEVDICADLEWFDDERRPVEGPLFWRDFWNHSMSAKLLFWSAKDGWPIDPRSELVGVKRVAVKLYMPTHGHGSDLPIVSEVSNRVGQFYIEKIRFVMMADAENPWEVRVQLKTSDVLDLDPHEPEDINVLSQQKLNFTRVEARSL